MNIDANVDDIQNDDNFNQKETTDEHDTAVYSFCDNGHEKWE